MHEWGILTHTVVWGASNKLTSAFRFPGMKGDWKRGLGAFSFSPSLSTSLEGSWNLPPPRSCPWNIPGISHPQDLAPGTLLELAIPKIPQGHRKARILSMFSLDLSKCSWCCRIQQDWGETRTIHYNFLCLSVTGKFAPKCNSCPKVWQEAFHEQLSQEHTAHYDAWFSALWTKHPAFRFPFGRGFWKPAEMPGASSISSRRF